MKRRDAITTLLKVAEDLLYCCSAEGEWSCFAGRDSEASFLTGKDVRSSNIEQIHLNDGRRTLTLTIPASVHLEPPTTGAAAVQRLQAIYGSLTSSATSRETNVQRQRANLVYRLACLWTPEGKSHSLDIHPRTEVSASWIEFDPPPDENICFQTAAAVLLGETRCTRSTLRIRNESAEAGATVKRHQTVPVTCPVTRLRWLAVLQKDAVAQGISDEVFAKWLPDQQTSPAK